MKTIKATNEVIVGSIPALNELIGKDLPPIPSHKMSLNMDAIEKISKAFETARTGLLKKLGVEDKEKKGQYTIPEKNRVAYQKEFEGLLKYGNSLKIDKIKITENFPMIKPMTLKSLSYLIEGNDDSK